VNGGGEGQAASRRYERRKTHEQEPPQSLIHLSEHPKKSQIFGKAICHYWWTYSCLAPELRFTLGFLENSQRCTETLPGPWVPVGCGKWPHRAGDQPRCMLCWWAAPLACVLALCSLPSNAARLLLARQDALDTQKKPVIILPKVVLGFWRLPTWQQAHAALLVCPEMLYLAAYSLGERELSLKPLKGELCFHTVSWRSGEVTDRGAGCESSPKHEQLLICTTFFLSLLLPAVKPEP